jgi:hypothetical protein
MNALGRVGSDSAVRVMGTAILFGVIRPRTCRAAEVVDKLRHRWEVGRGRTLDDEAKLGLVFRPNSWLLLDDFEHDPREGDAMPDRRNDMSTAGYGCIAHLKVSNILEILVDDS